MLNFEEELSRFQESVEIANVEEEIMKTDLTDAKDILFALLKRESKEQR